MEWKFYGDVWGKHVKLHGRTKMEIESAQRTAVYLEVPSVNAA